MRFLVVTCSLSPNSELNYEEDIAPWLSGMAIAHFPSFNPFSQDKNVLVSPEAQAALNSIQKMALTASQPEPSVDQIDLFLSLTAKAIDQN